MHKSQELLLIAGLLFLLNLGFPVAAGENVFNLAVYHPTSTKPPAGINGVVAHVMANHGYKVNFLVVPAKRMHISLSNGTIDSFQSSELFRYARLGSENDGFIRSKYPIFNYQVQIYYKASEQWSPNWPPSLDFKTSADGVTMNYPYMNAFGLDVTSVGSYEAGVRMVNAGRADYWFDVFRSKSASVGRLFKSEAEGFRLEKFFDNPLYLLFRDDENGRQLRGVWDHESELIYKDLELFRKIYFKDLDSNLYKSAFPELVEYLHANFPELK